MYIWIGCRHCLSCYMIFLLPGNTSYSSGPRVCVCVRRALLRVRVCVCVRACVCACSGVTSASVPGDLCVTAAVGRRRRAAEISPARRSQTAFSPTPVPRREDLRTETETDPRAPRAASTQGVSGGGGWRNQTDVFTGTPACSYTARCQISSLFLCIFSEALG